MFKPVVAWGNSSNVFIPNGSRLYLDVGSHPEYATAETTRFDELIATDAAGDSIMHTLVIQAQQARSEEHTSELQSRFDLVCRLLLAKKNHSDWIPGARH